MILDLLIPTLVLLLGGALVFAMLVASNQQQQSDLDLQDRLMGLDEPQPEQSKTKVTKGTPPAHPNAYRRSCSSERCSTEEKD